MVEYLQLITYACSFLSDSVTLKSLPPPQHRDPFNGPG